MIADRFTRRSILLLTAVWAIFSGAGHGISSIWPQENGRPLSDMRDGIPTSGNTFAGSQHVLVRGADGRLFLSYAKNIDGFEQLYAAVSADNGVS
jgi:hypothetical protein